MIGLFKTHQYMTSPGYEVTTITFPFSCCHCLKLFCNGVRGKQKYQPRWRQIIPKPLEGKHLPLTVQQALQKLPTWREGKTAEPHDWRCPDLKGKQNLPCGQGSCPWAAAITEEGCPASLPGVRSLPWLCQTFPELPPQLSLLYKKKLFTNCLNIIGNAIIHQLRCFVIPAEP